MAATQRFQRVTDLHGTILMLPKAVFTGRISRKVKMPGKRAWPVRDGAVSKPRPAQMSIQTGRSAEPHALPGRIESKGKIPASRVFAEFVMSIPAPIMPSTARPFASPSNISDIIWSSIKRPPTEPPRRCAIFSLRRSAASNRSRQSDHQCLRRERCGTAESRRRP